LLATGTGRGFFPLFLGLSDDNKAFSGILGIFFVFVLSCLSFERSELIVIGLLSFLIF
jgi:hypothetical protein